MACAADHDADMNRSVFASWIDVFLGVDRSQRTRVMQTLVAAGVYAGLCAVTGLGVWLGLIEWHAAAVLCGAVLAAQLLFYTLIRSGLNLRFGSDPALTQAQSLFCVLACSVAYVLAGPMRGAMLMVLLIGQVFGIFALTPRQARRTAAVGVLAMGVTMAGCAHLDPARFAPRQELLHFLMIALALPTVGWLTGTLGMLRGKLRQQKAQLENALAQNRLLATQDELTGLSNRRHMTSLMVAERGRQQRSRTPISLVLMDIDHFKRINDGCGHPAGDQVLQIFSDVIAHGLRAGDALARWGGEEFLLMLPDTSAEDALVCVERMRGQLAARSFDHIAPKLSVTFSAGIGVCGVDDRTDAIVERADRAMYRAKTGGRNRTVVA
jgi:diguanylate cyclase (GGDEF)-like protein